MQKSELYEKKLKEIASAHQPELQTARAGVTPDNDLLNAGHIPVCGKDSVAGAFVKERLAESLSEMCGLWEHMCQTIGRPVVESAEYVRSKELLKKYEEQQALTKKEQNHGQGKGTR